MPTPIRPVRVPDEVWDAAVAKAKAEGTSAAAVIVKALKAYIRRPARTQANPEAS